MPALPVQVAHVEQDLLVPQAILPAQEVRSVSPEPFEVDARGGIPQLFEVSGEVGRLLRIVIRCGDDCTGEVERPGTEERVVAPPDDPGRKVVPRQVVVVGQNVRNLHPGRCPGGCIRDEGNRHMPVYDVRALRPDEVPERPLPPEADGGAGDLELVGQPDHLKAADLLGLCGVLLLMPVGGDDGQVVPEYPLQSRTDLVDIFLHATHVRVEIRGHHHGLHALSPSGWGEGAQSLI
ncbi:MAG: hypothetical protein BWX50_00650 [Euryarchaeota archaeon ADurb.Bin009]|nr:MAG: hypothetical protein BWX50_00650 [Euryarchaeota archaeon ADurb.Bin009]